MEEFGASGFNGANALAKRRRSGASRKPRPTEELVADYQHLSAVSFAQAVMNPKRFQPNKTGGSDGGFRRKEIYLNDPAPRSTSVNMIEGSSGVKKSRKDDRSGREYDTHSGSSRSRSGHPSDSKRCSEGVLAPANWKSTSYSRESFEMLSGSPDGNGVHQTAAAPNLSAESKLRKVKLKVGGVTRTLHAKSNLELGDGGLPSAKPSHSTDAFLHSKKLVPQRDHQLDSRGSSISHVVKEHTPGKIIEGDKFHNVSSSEPVRKSKRVPKRRVLDGEFGGGEDDEVRYLEKLKTFRVAADHSIESEDTGEDSSKKQKMSNVPWNRNIPYEVDEDFIMLRSDRDRKKLRLGKEPEDTDYVEEEEAGSDGGTDAKRTVREISVESPADPRNEPLTTRQRALQSGKGANGESLIEFPNGLPPAPSRKQKEKLSEVEKQAKKAEAAQRRKMQVEKAAREAEAEAIRKILGLDSDKKKEEKKQKELEEKKAARSQASASGIIRCIMGPTGTVIIFPEDVGLPSIFDSKPCRYPPPREKCAGPSCTNPYKYRDSKSKLPLCSLECYRAVQVAGR